jgi:hypothetical protein
MTSAYEHQSLVQVDFALAAEFGLECVTPKKSIEEDFLIPQK